MNETVKTLLISLSCLVADFSGIAIVAKCLLKKWTHIKDDVESAKIELKKAKDELIKTQKALNEVKEAIQWQIQADENLKLELRGVRGYGSSNKKN